MKRSLSLWLTVVFLSQTVLSQTSPNDPVARAAAEAANRQEAEERAQRLRAIIEDVVAAQSAQQKRMLDLIGDMKVLSDETANAIGKCATTAEVKKLDERITAIDKRREADKEAIMAEVEKLAKAVRELAKIIATTPAPAPTVVERPHRPGSGSPNLVKIKPSDDKKPDVKTPEVKPTESAPPKLEKGVEHVVNKGEFFSTILAAYNAEFKKLGKKSVSEKQVLAANPRLNPNNIRVGQKIFIPVLD